MRFTWDPAKAKSNLRKHKVSFEEAVVAFLDPHGLRIPDPDHSDLEDRYVLLGFDDIHRLLVVVHVERDEETIRIISARKANSKEKTSYVRSSR